MAFQIAFDLYESATQQFLGRVQSALRNTAPIPITEPAKTQEKKEDNDKETYVHFVVSFHSIFYQITCVWLQAET